MRVIVSTEHRFAKSLDGSVYSITGGREYRFWARYLEVFDEVTIVGRVAAGACAVPASAKACGPNVSFLDLPPYRGPRGFAAALPQVIRRWNAGKDHDAAYVLRVPSVIGTILAQDLIWTRHPYGVEVVGDPRGVFARGATQHPLRPFFGFASARALKQQCARASSASYVTDEALQRLYPPAAGAFSTHYSDVELPRDAFAINPKIRGTHLMPEDPITVVTVGSLAQPYKGVDVLIDAISLCVNMGLNAHLTVIGDGGYRPALEAQVRSLGLEKRVTFLGQIPAGMQVREQLDSGNIFVLASRTEGLPRAMIEAMARGLPCIGTSVGGIPDLLRSDALVPVNDANALANRIQQFATNPSLLNDMAAKNLAKAQEYREDILRERRLEMLHSLRQGTEQWLSKRRN